MKAAVMHTQGALPCYDDFAEPAAAGGLEIVDLIAAGVHPVVRSLAEGRHYGSTGQWPLIPGVDAVARTAGGATVYTGYVRPPYGTLAERMAVPAGMRIALPDGADPVRIAAGLNPGLASWLPLRSRLAGTGTLGTVVVLGATGTAGLIAVQNALVLGARRVIGAGRNTGALDRVAAAGALPVRLTGDQAADTIALAEALDEAVAAGAAHGDGDSGGGAGPDSAPGSAPMLVLDFIWGAPAQAMFAALGRRGLSEDAADISYVQIGALAGPDAALPAALLRSRRITVSGSGAGSASVASIIEQLPGYMRLIADGRIQVPVRVFPLPEISQAWVAARDSGTRVVVVPG